MDKVIILEVNFNFGYGDDVIYPVVLQDEDEMILIDCGYPEFLPIIEQKALEKDINILNLTKLIITHHDHDHMGSAYEIKTKYPNIQIIASKKDTPYIAGNEKSLRLKQAEELQDLLSLEQKDTGIAFQNLLKSIKNVNVDIMVEDRDKFPYCSGIEIIETPGHMPGHISIYIDKFKTLISGDALAVENGNLVIAAPQYTLDMEESKKSIEKLLKYDIEKVICYHGGEYIGDVKLALMQCIK